MTMNTLLEKIRNAPPETKTFTVKVGSEDIELTAKRFQPGTASRLRKTALIKLHKSLAVADVNLGELSESEFAEHLESAEADKNELNQQFIECIVDEEYNNYLSLEVVEEYFDNITKRGIVDWALDTAATAKEADTPDEIDQFPPPSDGSGE